MLLAGSCHCHAVRFRLVSAQPYPYQRCYCGVCRKTQGGGGYAVNLGGVAASLEVEGRENISIYHARIDDDGHEYTSTAERHFCSKCGSALWLFSPEWPDLIHPFASAIDTPLPTPPTLTHLMLRFKAPWVSIETYGPEDKRHDEYPKESLAAWHDRLGLTDDSQ
ncbi:MAG TPA: GFA family protein [Stellaceae bacterium]|nr:GFA family protein [Stellaceae bacterium]